MLVLRASYPGNGPCPLNYTSGRGAVPDAARGLVSDTLHRRTTMAARIDSPSGIDPSRLADPGPGLGPFVAISVVYLLALLAGSWSLGHFEQLQTLAPDQWGDML